MPLPRSLSAEPTVVSGGDLYGPVEYLPTPRGTRRPDGRYRPASERRHGRASLRHCAAAFILPVARKERGIRGSRTL